MKIPYYKKNKKDLNRVASNIKYRNLNVNKFSLTSNMAERNAIPTIEFTPNSLIPDQYIGGTLLSEEKTGYVVSSREKSTPHYFNTVRSEYINLLSFDSDLKFNGTLITAEQYSKGEDRNIHIRTFKKHNANMVQYGQSLDIYLYSDPVNISVFISDDGNRFCIVYNDRNDIYNITYEFDNTVSKWSLLNKQLILASSNAPVTASSNSDLSFIAFSYKGSDDIGYTTVRGFRPGGWYVYGNVVEIQSNFNLISPVLLKENDVDFLCIVAETFYETSDGVIYAYKFIDGEYQLTSSQTL